MTEEKTDNFMALKAFTKSEAKFEIGGKTFEMKPLVPKKLRDLLQIIENSGKEMEQFQDLKSIIEFVLDRIVDIFPIIFDKEINQQFADNNMSIPLCVEIWENFVKLNRLEGILPFFQKIIKVTKERSVPIR